MQQGAPKMHRLHFSSGRVAQVLFVISIKKKFMINWQVVCLVAKPCDNSISKTLFFSVKETQQTGLKN